MKKHIFLTLFLFSVLTVSSFAQSTVSEPTQEPIVPYRLFKTTNRWTFIELDTRTGKMYQIQYDVQDNNRGAFILSDKDLAENKEKISGRFTLYPT